MFRYFVFWLVIGLAGCVSPQYQTAYRFTPPPAGAGKVCLTRCDASLAQCKNQCAAKTSQCLAKARSQAQSELPVLLGAWEREILVWEKAMDRYETELRFWEMEMRQRRLMYDLQRDLRPCRPGERHCTRYPRRPHFGYPGAWDRPESPGPAPKRPTLASETARIQAETCPNDCGCDASYRQCYASCGGNVQPYQVCSKNCGG
ncbi:hypothetical protein [Thiothrix eikelboomii]|uniref:hypothetical protein n=1 Tax=Thiothrix eikelboomii TaxID=92487 RepID=UPI003BB08B04